MATTNIYALNQVSRKPRRVRSGKPCCWGPEDAQHVDGCTKSSPRCRWRRAGTRCYCPAFHYPHRKGSGACGNPALMNAPVELIAPLPIGPGMTMAAWWDARAELCELFFAAGGLIVAPELAARARDLLEGRALPARRHASGRSGADARRWWVARRAIVELLAPAFGEPDGAVVDVDLASHVRALFDGAAKPPRLANARTLAKTRPRPLAWTPAPRAACDSEPPF